MATIKKQNGVIKFPISVQHFVYVREGNRTSSGRDANDSRCLIGDRGREITSYVLHLHPEL